MCTCEEGMQADGLPVDSLLGGPKSGSDALHVVMALTTLGSTWTLAQVRGHLADGRHLCGLGEPAECAVTWRQHAPGQT